MNGFERRVTAASATRAERGHGGRVVAAVAVACAATWIVLLAPGFMSPDSADQLRQARSGAFSDWHAPLGSLLWIATELVVTGPMGMLILQSAILWTGLALLANRIAAPPAARAAFLVVLAVAPPIVSIAGAIWKDVLMAALLTLAFGATDRRRAFWPVALLATMSRHNAIPAVAVAVLLHVAPDRVTPRALLRAAAASALLLGASLAVNLAVADRRTNPAQVFLLGDFVGISVTTQTVPTIDPCHQRLAQSAPARAVAHDDDPKLKAALVGVATQFTYCTDQTASRTLLERWLALVTEHPAAYLHVRSRLAGQLLGIDATPGNFMLTRSMFDHARFGLEPPQPTTAFQQWLGERLWAMRDSLLFRPWIYGVLGVVACVVGAARRRRWPCFIALSGLACEATLFVVAPSADYRYSYWMIVSALIAALWLLIEAIAGRGRIPRGD